MRARFDAAVMAGGEKGVSIKLIDTMQGLATSITRLINTHWASALDGSEDWPVLRGRKNEHTAAAVRSHFAIFVEKQIAWLDYFVRDPRWLKLPAVNYAANAAREAGQDLRQARSELEDLYAISRQDLVPKARGDGRVTPAPKRPARAKRAA